MLFGLDTKIKSIFITKEVSGEVKDIKMGKLGSAAKAVWNFLDGKKRIIMVLLLGVEYYMRQHGTTGPITYIDAIVKGLGWDTVAPDVDPAQIAVGIGSAIAIIHAIKKNNQVK